MRWRWPPDSEKPRSPTRWRSPRAGRTRSRGRRRGGPPARSGRRRRPRDRRRRCWRRRCRRRGTSPRTRSPTAAAELVQGELADVDAVEADRCRRRRRRSGGGGGRSVDLPEPVAPTRATDSPGAIVRSKSSSTGAVVARVGEPDRRRSATSPTARPDRAGQGHRPGRVDDLGLGGEHLVHPLGGGGGSLGLGEDHAEHPQRPDQHHDVDVEGDEGADRQLAVEHERGRRSRGWRRGRGWAGARGAASTVDRTERRPHRCVVDVVGLDAEPPAAARPRRRSP